MTVRVQEFDFLQLCYISETIVVLFTALYYNFSQLLLDQLVNTTHRWPVVIFYAEISRIDTIYFHNKMLKRSLIVY